ELSSGYCVDDVARLAIVAADLLTVGLDVHPTALAGRWLRQSMRFLLAAHDPSSPVGAWHNVLSYSGPWQEGPHLGDHVGRAIWSLGELAAAPAVPRDVADLAGQLLDAAAPHLDVLADMGLRSGAYALIGFARAGRTEPAAKLLRRLDT